MWSADFLSTSPWTSWKMTLRSMVWGIWDHDDTLRSQLERWFWSYFIFRWSLESQIIWGCDGVRAVFRPSHPWTPKTADIVICTDIHKDTHIGFQWIRGLRLKQLKKTHTYACTHSWFIFIASHKLTAGHWQSAFVQSAITAWQRASIYGESAGQTTAVGQEQRSPRRARLPSRVLLPQHGVTALWTPSISIPPGGLDLPVLSTLELPSLCQPGFPQSLGNTGY